MNIIKDEQRQINLHPLMIYLVMSSEDCKERAAAVNRMNRRHAFTRNLFKFRTIEHIDKQNNEISTELANYIKRYNMIVRLIDNTDNSFYYAVRKINFNLNDAEVGSAIQKFVGGVCKKNFDSLSKKIETLLLQGDVSIERILSLQQMQKTFYDAMTTEGIKPKGGPISTTEKDIIENPKDKMSQENTINGQAAVNANTPESIAPSIESYTGAPDRSTSDAIVTGLYDASRATALKRDLRQRTPPQVPLTVSVEVKQIVKRVLKNGREKKDYGVVFMVNHQEAHPVRFGSKDQRMLYLCTLLRKKIGEKMYLHEFYHNSKGQSHKSRFKRGTSTNWLKAVYDAIFPNDGRDYADWIEKAKSGRPLHQGKTQSNSSIAKALGEENPGLYYCVVNTIEDEIGDSYYDIKISPENIIIPHELQFLLDRFDQLMGLALE